MYGDEMPEFDDEGNVIEKAKKKKKRKSKKEKKKKGSGGFMDSVYDGIDTVKGWMEPFWGDDGKGDL